MTYCVYYQAKVNRSKTWFFAATLRSFENLCFDRTFSAKDEIFEFLVPEALEHYFLIIMKYYQDNQIISNLEKLPNRYKSI